MAKLLWSETAADADRPAAVKRTVSLCMGRPAKKIDVPRVAEADGYSRYNFSRAFTARYGTTTTCYLPRLRMQEAARLLRVEEAPVEVMAGRCGFDDANFFVRVFRRFYGVGPRDIRRSGMYAGAMRTGRTVTPAA